MVPIGNRPILWHVMKYYAHYGHKDFILCLGHKAEVIKEYFLDYNEALSNDFVLPERRPAASSCFDSDIDDWAITFVDTGLQRQRRRAAAGGATSTSRARTCFLANYGDGLTDAPLPELIDDLAAQRQRSRASCACRPRATRSTWSRRRRRTTSTA